MLRRRRRSAPGRALFAATRQRATARRSQQAVVAGIARPREAQIIERSWRRLRLPRTRWCADRAAPAFRPRFRRELRSPLPATPKRTTSPSKCARCTRSERAGLVSEALLLSEQVVTELGAGVATRRGAVLWFHRGSSSRGASLFRGELDDPDAGGADLQPQARRSARPWPARSHRRRRRAARSARSGRTLGARPRQGAAARWPTSRTSELVPARRINYLSEALEQASRSGAQMELVARWRTCARAWAVPWIPYIARWDLDKTYTADRVRDVARSRPHGTSSAPTRRRTVARARATLLSRRSRATGASVHILSGSPEQLRAKLEEKLRLDGRPRWDSSPLKPNLRNVLRLPLSRWFATRVIKLPALLSAPALLSVVQEDDRRSLLCARLLIGDDAESDAAVCLLYADVVAGYVVAAQRAGGSSRRGAAAYKDAIADASCRYARTRRARRRGGATFSIHLETASPPSDFAPYGRAPACPSTITCKQPFVSEEDGRLPPAAVIRVAVDLVLDHRFDGEAPRSQLPRSVAPRATCAAPGRPAIGRAFHCHGRGRAASQAREIEKMCRRLDDVASSIERGTTAARAPRLRRPTSSATVAAAALSSNRPAAWCAICCERGPHAVVLDSESCMSSLHSRCGAASMLGAPQALRAGRHGAASTSAPAPSVSDISRSRSTSTPPRRASPAWRTRRRRACRTPRRPSCVSMRSGFEIESAVFVGKKKTAIRYVSRRQHRPPAHAPRDVRRPRSRIAYRATPARGSVFLEPGRARQGSPAPGVDAVPGRGRAALVSLPRQAARQDDVRALDVQVPRGWFALSNGELWSNATTSRAPSAWRYHWKHDEPLPSYLVTLVAGEFSEIDGRQGRRACRSPTSCPRGARPTGKRTFRAHAGDDRALRRAHRRPLPVEQVRAGRGHRLHLRRHGEHHRDDDVRAHPARRARRARRHRRTTSSPTSSRTSGSATYVTCRDWSHGLAQRGLRHASSSTSIASTTSAWTSTSTALQRRPRARTSPRRTAATAVPSCARTTRRPIDIFDRHLYQEGRRSSCYMLRARRSATTCSGAGVART